MEITSTFIAVQIIGLFAATATIASVQFKRRQTIILLIVIAGVLASAVYLIQGAIGGLALNTSGIVLAILAYFFERRGRAIPLWLVLIFGVVTLGLAMLTFADGRDLAAIIAQMAFVVSMGARSSNATRVALLINVGSWLIFNILIGAYTSVIGNAFFVISDVIALIRYRKVKYVKAKNHQR